MSRRRVPLLLAALTMGLCACAGFGPHRDFRGEMRGFVEGLSAYAKARRPGFIVLAHNALPLLTKDGSPSGRPATAYLNALDGVLQESLFFSHSQGPTAPEQTRRLCAFLDLAKRSGLAALALDYPSDQKQAEESDRRCRAQGYLCFAGEKDLDRIPPPHPSPRHDVRTLGEARDFLYILNPRRFADRDSYLKALRQADGDVLVIDLFFGTEALSASDVSSLKDRPDGGRRLVLAYMSVGEASDYRYYWKPEFKAAPPRWLEAGNPAWPGDFKVRYWDPAWRKLVYGGKDSYLDRILAAGFDGAALDVVDAYSYFESQRSRR